MLNHSNKTLSHFDASINSSNAARTQLREFNVENSEKDAGKPLVGADLTGVPHMLGDIAIDARRR